MPATALEQLLLELINRARLDPAAEAARYGIDLNEGVAANETISTVSKQPLAMNETLLAVARAHSQDMIDRDYFAHDTPEGVTPYQRMTNAGYNWNAAGENIAWYGTTGGIINQNTIDLHQSLFVDSGINGRGHRTNLMLADFQEIGVGDILGTYQAYNATMLTEDFGRTGSQQFLTGVSYADGDHNNFYSLGEGRNGMSVAVSGGGSTATAGAGGYSLAIGAGAKTVTFSGGGLSSAISVAVSIAAGTNAKVDVIDQSTIHTSVSLTDLGGLSTIVGLGTIGLTLTGDGGDDTISGAKGNDTLNGGGGIDTAVYAGARSAYSVTRAGADFQVSGPDGTDHLVNMERVAFADVSGNLSDLIDVPQTHWMASVDLGPHPAGWSPAGVGDFNRDGTGDIAWFNNQSGETELWLLANGHWSASIVLGTHNTAWQPAGIGDFNADGTSDVAWFNATNGDMEIWKTQNGQWAGSVDLGPHNTAWRPVGIGDFNADGTSDIAWYNATNGDMEIWKTLDGKWAGSVDYGPHNTAWRPAGIGDFNNDGTSDILWYNPTTGDAEIWKTLNGQWAGSVDLGVHPLGWTPVGVADFNNDGTSDILWYNPNNGNVEIWKTLNGAWAGSINVGNHPPGAQVTGIGDVNHDGTTDILWRDPATTHVEAWLLSNA